MSDLNFSEVTRLYCDAEQKIKKVEHLTTEVAIPAINQLRYAGQHLVRVVGGLSENPKEDLEQAENHCKRACYDACEAGLLYCLDNFRSLQQDFSDTPISQFFPEYLQACEANDEAREFVDVTPEGSREDFYRAIEAHLDVLIPMNKKLPYIRDEINKELRREARNTRYVLIGLALAALGLIVAVIALPYFNKDCPPQNPPVKAKPVGKS